MPSFCQCRLCSALKPTGQGRECKSKNKERLYWYCFNCLKKIKLVPEEVSLSQWLNRIEWLEKAEKLKKKEG